MVLWSKDRKRSQKEPAEEQTPSKRRGISGTLGFLMNPLSFIWSKEVTSSSAESSDDNDENELVVTPETSTSKKLLEDCEVIAEKTIEIQEEFSTVLSETPKRRSSKEKSSPVQEEVSTIVNVDEDDDLQVISEVKVTPTRQVAASRLFQERMNKLIEKDEDDSDAGSAVSFLDSITNASSPQPEDSASRMCSPAVRVRKQQDEGSQRTIKDKFQRKPTPKMFVKKPIQKVGASAIKSKNYKNEQALRKRTIYAKFLESMGIPQSPLMLNSKPTTRINRGPQNGGLSIRSHIEKSSLLLASLKKGTESTSASSPEQTEKKPETLSETSVLRGRSSSISSETSLASTTTQERMRDITERLHSVQVSTPIATGTFDRYINQHQAGLRRTGGLSEETRIRDNVREWKKFEIADVRRENLAASGLRFIPVPKPKPIPDVVVIDDFPELSDEDDQLVSRAWNKKLPEAEVLSQGFGVEVARRDLAKLHGLAWLNDEVINFYLQLIAARSQANEKLPKVHAFNTFFYRNVKTKGYASVKRWTRKIDIFAHDLVLVPVHLEAHWCMATIDFAGKAIEYYDSMLGSNKTCLDLLKKYVEEESLDKKKIAFDWTGWNFVMRSDIPTQQNHSDCGVFACQFAEWAARRRPVAFDQSKMPYFRRKMVVEIINQKLMV